MPFRFAALSIGLTPEKKRFLWQHLRSVLLWPFVCLILAILLSVLLLSLLNTAKRDLEEKALTDAHMLSKTYAQQIARTIGQLDHVTALLKSYWEYSEGTFRLEKFKRDTHFIDESMVGISLSNRNGKIVSSTLPQAPGSFVVDRSYFKFHQTNHSTGLHIGQPLAGRFGDKEIVTFTRRLSLNNGDFGGVIIASTGTQFLAEFANHATLGTTGILALVGFDGMIRAAKIGDKTESLLHPAVIKKSIVGAIPFMTAVGGSDWFADDIVRYTASEPVPGYPLYAIVGLGQPDVLQPLDNLTSTYLRIAIGGGSVLVLFALVSFVMSLRLAWRKHQEQTVRDTYRVATEGANEGFYMWRPIYDDQDRVCDYELVDCNERGAQIYGSERKDILGARLTQLYNGELLEKLLKLVPKVMRTGFHEDEFETINDSLVRPAWIYRRFVRAGDGIAVTLRDISERKQLEQETSRMAEQDSLTQLPNRHWLGSYLPVALERAASQRQTLAVLFVDLDKFKAVNDSWGHSIGDKLLHAVAERMHSVIRPHDKIARFGGDEFIVVLEGPVRDSDAADVAHRIARTLEAPFHIEQRECLVGASIGISLFPRDGTEAETLIKHADIAMYTAKSNAKGLYRFFDQEHFAQIQSAREIERELMHAVEADQFILHYQPRVDATSGAMVGLEALVRWNHPVRGVVYPGEFISIAESSGLILRLGEIVMEKACLQLAHWRSMGMELVPVSVNASAKQFNEGKVRSLLENNVARHGIPASLIEIELTESVMVSNAEQVMDELAALHAMGVSVHLDDFGTGYSSLSILRKLDVDVLKVDRAFTSELGEGEESEVYFGAIISMAKALGMRVIAEGVETPTQLQVLQRLGCDEIQGYLISKPMPADRIPDFHHQSKALFASVTAGVDRSRQQEALH